MRLLLQRVTRARVTVADSALSDSVRETGPGLLVLAGFGDGDSEDLPKTPLWTKMLSKVVDLRIFQDEHDKMNRSLRDVGGDLMVVSQFTLYADCKKGRRPSFTASCPPERAERLYHALLYDLIRMAPAKVASGEFGAEMLLDFTNHGPVTILLDSDTF